LPNETGSTVPRRQLGRYLRQYREAAGVSMKNAYDHLEWSYNKMWRLETGQPSVAIRATDVDALCRLYGLSDDVRGALINLARASKEKGWWQSYGTTIPKWFELYVGLEAAASRLRIYEPALVPGLLQAHAYIEAVFRAERPPASEEDLAPRVQVKQERQRLLQRFSPPPPRLEVILSEAVLLAKLEAPGAMQQQLFGLLQVNRLPHVSVRVLPLAVGPHPASVGGGFTILEFPPGEGGREGEPPTVYSEGVTGALYLDEPAEIKAYEDVWGALAELALSEGDSNDMITATLKILGETPS
jgi:hypothetical protein